MIAVPSSNNLVVKNFQHWLISPETIASFQYPPNAKVSTFQKTLKKTALNSYDTTQSVDLPPSSN
jgi:hypothetical protein